MSSFGDFIDRYPYVLFVPMAALVAGMIWNVRRGNRSRLTDLLEGLDLQDAEIVGGFSMRLEGRYHGQSATIRFGPGGQNSPRQLHVMLVVPDSMSFRVRTQNLATRFATSLRVMRDLEVGAPELDDRFVFSAGEPERFAAWIRDASEARRALLALVREHGVDLLEKEPELLHATLVRYSREEREPDNLRAILDGLEVIARSLAAMGPARSSGA